MLTPETRVLPANEVTSVMADGIFDVFKDPFGDDRLTFDCALNLLSTHVAVRTIGRDVISFAMLNHDRDEVMLAFIATNPGYQRESHARKLMQTVETFAQESGARKISTDIDPERGAFRALVKKLGYMNGSLIDRFEKAV